MMKMLFPILACALECVRHLPTLFCRVHQHASMRGCSHGNQPRITQCNSGKVTCLDYNCGIWKCDQSGAVPQTLAAYAGGRKVVHERLGMHQQDASRDMMRAFASGSTSGVCG